MEIYPQWPGSAAREALGFSSRRQTTIIPSATVFGISRLFAISSAFVFGRRVVNARRYVLRFID
jgi:hypothetical protein